MHTRLDLMHTWLDLMHTWLDLMHTKLDLMHTRLDLIHQEWFVVWKILIYYGGKYFLKKGPNYPIWQE